MKSLLLSSIFIFSFLFGISQVPEGYYNGTEGLGGGALKTALYNIIKGHTEFDYTSTGTDVWDILKETDKDPDNPNNVILIYSGRSVDAAQEWNNGDGWEREHVWAKSRGNFGTEPGAGTDVHHIRPCDSDVNSARNNRWFAECTTEYIDNGFPTGSYIDYGDEPSDWVWKPRDEVKGDVARMIFYMATRYEGENGEPDLEIIDYFPADIYTNEPIHALLSDLLVWNVEDPVDTFEQNRNNVIYSYQKNRNPFIDHPEWVQCIWDGNCSGMWFASYPITEMTEREDYSYNISASGSSDVTLTITGEIIPAWLTFNSTSSTLGSATATLIGSPEFSDIGTHQVSLKVNDGTKDVFQNYEIVVVDGNPITFTSIPETTATVDDLYTYDITATGDDGASFTLTGTTLPAWLSLNVNTVPATLSGTPLVGNIGINSVELTLTDDTKKTITQNFDIIVNEFANQVIISQYYEGTTGSNKFIEITNVGDVAVDLSDYYLGRWSTTVSPSGIYANGDALSGSIAAGETQVYKHASATIPAYAVAIGIPTTACYINGDDPVALMRNGNTWDYRVDCIYSSVIVPRWGEETSFYRKSDIITGNMNESILDGTGEWIEVTESVVNNASNDMTEYLGFHVGITDVKTIEHSKIKLHPNPVSDFLFLETNKQIENIKILTVSAKQIKQVNNYNRNSGINVSNLGKGLYFLKITNLNGLTTFNKFIKQ